MACTSILDETIHQSGVKVGVGTPICCRILGFQETREVFFVHTSSILHVVSLKEKNCYFQLEYWANKSQMRFYLF